jgi:hypothetical protein
MSSASVLFGLLLAAIGAAGYVMSDMVSPTALIPAAFGVVIAMLGLYGRDPARRRTAMHLAMGIALVGILGSIGGVFTLAGAVASGSAPGLAALSRASMAIVLILYLTMGVRSFVAARRARDA